MIFLLGAEVLVGAVIGLIVLFTLDLQLRGAVVRLVQRSATYPKLENF